MATSTVTVNPVAPLQVTATNSINPVWGASAASDNWSDTLYFPKFNPALGTLVEVDLVEVVTIQSAINATNTSWMGYTNGSAGTYFSASIQDPGLGSGPVASVSSSGNPYSFYWSLGPNGSSTSSVRL